MLMAAHRSHKLPIKYVELGNELYLLRADYAHYFPTAKDYGKVVAADVKALHRAFPRVLVAAVGSADNGSRRAAGWNSGMLSETKGSGRPNVVALHDHPVYNKSLTASGLPALFTLPYTSAASLARIRSMACRCTLPMETRPSTPMRTRYGKAKPPSSSRSASVTRHW